MILIEMTTATNNASGLQITRSDSMITTMGNTMRMTTPRVIKTFKLKIAKMQEQLKKHFKVINRQRVRILLLIAALNMIVDWDMPN